MLNNMDKEILVEECDVERELVVNVEGDSITPLSEECIVCGKEINLLESHDSLVHSVEKYNLGDEELSVSVKSSESLVNFCSEECYELFVKKIKGDV